MDRTKEQVSRALREALQRLQPSIMDRGDRIQVDEITLVRSPSRQIAERSNSLR